MRIRRSLYSLMPVLFLLQALAAQQPDLAAVTAAAFREVHDGWSSDEVLLQDELYSKFLDRCRTGLPGATDEQFAWSLLNLRKAGKLDVKTTRRSRRKATAHRHVAEIAARFMEDKHTANMDRVICSPEWRTEFNKLAASMAPDAASYELRKAAFRLRKTRRLQPEFVVRIGDWEREIATHQMSEIQDDQSAVSSNPGVYLFRDATGYLYIGESKNVRNRLREHLDKSEPSSLRNIFLSQQIDLDQITIEVHSFGPDTKAKETRIRRAYESELIASRRPRFNLRP